MSAGPRLPYLFKRYGQHNMVRLVDPEHLDLTQPFFRFALPASGGGESMETFDTWLAAQPEPNEDYADFCGIFHVSRCGSTLLARNIQASGQAVVLSEPPFFRILRHRMNDTISADVAWRACLAMLAAWRKWARRLAPHLVIKFNSQLHEYQRDIFARMPGARFLFLHREPAAVFESLIRKPAPYLQHGPSAAGLANLPQVRCDPLLLAAASRYCPALDAFAALDRPDLMAVDYQELGDRYGAILAHFRLDPQIAPPWSAHGDAKAATDGTERTYIPVSPCRVAQFARDHEDILAIAGAHYRRFVAMRRDLGA